MCIGLNLGCAAQLTCLCVLSSLLHLLQAEPAVIPGDAGIRASPGVVIQLSTTTTHTFTIRANGEGTSKQVSVSIGFPNATTAGLQDATVHGSDGSKGERVMQKTVCNGTRVDPSGFGGRCRHRAAVYKLHSWPAGTPADQCTGYWCLLFCCSLLCMWRTGFPGRRVSCVVLQLGRPAALCHCACGADVQAHCGRDLQPNHGQPVSQQ